MMVLQTIPLGHLGTAPLLLCKSVPAFYAQNYAQRARLLPIYPESRRSNPLIPRNTDSKEGFCRPLPWATWVPRQTIEYSKSLVGEEFAIPGHPVSANPANHKTPNHRNEPHQTTQNPHFLKHACTNRPYFVAIGEATLASRKNRAASSGGVGLM